MPFFDFTRAIVTLLASGVERSNLIEQFEDIFNRRCVCCCFFTITQGLDIVVSIVNV